MAAGAFWSERSYSLFLIHFPICLVLTAWIAEYVIDRPHAALGLMIMEYAVSLIAAMAFYRLIEGARHDCRQRNQPCQSLKGSPRRESPLQAPG